MRGSEAVPRDILRLLLPVLAALLLAPGPAVALYNGTPAGVPTSFDCKARELAWQYGKQLPPQRGSFKSLFDGPQQRPWRWWVRRSWLLR